MHRMYDVCVASLRVLTRIGGLRRVSLISFIECLAARISFLHVISKLWKVEKMEVENEIRDANDNV